MLQSLLLMRRADLDSKLRKVSSNHQSERNIHYHFNRLEAIKSISLALLVAIGAWGGESFCCRPTIAFKEITLFKFTPCLRFIARD